MSNLTVSEQRLPDTDRAKHLTTICVSLQPSQAATLAKRAQSHNVSKSRVMQILLDIEERESILRHEITARLAQTRAFTQIPKNN